MSFQRHPPCDSITAEMITAAYLEFKAIIDNCEVSDVLKSDGLNLVRHLLEKDVKEYHFGWRPSTNTFFTFENIDIENGIFDYNNEIGINDFLARVTPLLKMTFNIKSLFENLTLALMHPEPGVRLLSSEILYRGYLGFVLFNTIVNSYYNIEWIASEECNQETVCYESMLFNHVWNNIVNYDPLKMEIYNQKSISPELVDVYIKPIIYVTPNRKVCLISTMVKSYYDVCGGEDGLNI